MTAHTRYTSADSPRGWLNGMVVEQDLPEFIARAQSGDASAISELYARYAGHVLRYLYARLREQETAQDLTQEVFIRVIKGIKGFEYRGDKSFLGWLYTIAGNVLIGHLRRSKVSYTALDDQIDLADPHGQDGVFAIFDRVALTQAMGHLTMDQQQVLILRFFADLSNADIARQLNRSEGAVKALQHRALQNLQQLMVRNDDDEAGPQASVIAPAPAPPNSHGGSTFEHKLQRVINGSTLRSHASHEG